MRLAVSSTGRVHRPDCRFAGNATLWRWALAEHRAYVALEIQRLDLRVCSVCQPMSLERDWREYGESLT